MRFRILSRIMTPFIRSEPTTSLLNISKGASIPMASYGGSPPKTLNPSSNSWIL